MENNVKETKISELKPGMNNVNVKVRVLEAEEPRVINTRKGPRTISEAVVGDETGRTRLTLWGHAAGSLKQGEAVEIHGAWTTAYRGQVVLNVGGKSNIEHVADEEVPAAEDVPEETPRAPEGYRPPRRGGPGGARGPYRRRQPRF
jgi:replication factor A1